MSPKPPAVHAGKIPYFSGSAARFTAPCAEQTGPDFSWQHQALNHSRIRDGIGKRHSEMSNRDQPPLFRMNISTQDSPRKTFDQLPLLLNSSYPKDSSHEFNTTIGNMRDSQCQACPSSASICGDLEGPSRLTPNKSRLPISDERQKTIRHPEDNLCTRYNGDFDQRSRSRTSNISRKRSSVNKHRSRTDPERKKMLMHQVAQYWNECISITEEEKSQAIMEVDQLREHLRQQQAKLEKVHQHLEKERTERQGIERKLKDSELVHAEALLKNSTLAQEANAVKEELRLSKERAAGLTEKCKTFRLKLNEAILEQQRLFLQAKDFYHETIQKLRQDNESRMAERNAVETALTACGEKRDEMRRCLDELRSGMEKEVELRGQRISHLQDKVSMQEQALATERQITSDLRRQVKPASPSQSAEVNDKIRQLEKEASRTTDLQERWHSDIHMVDSIRAKLRSLEYLPSQVDKYHDELEKSSQIRSLLESTSGYLAEQETWVKQQLEASTQRSSTNVVTPPRTAAEVQSGQLIEPTNSSGIIDNSHGGIRPDSDDMGSAQSSRPEFGPKRVQVQSPTEVYSPSSPPSVEQEQKRRRIPVTVRPILKANSVPSSQESTTSQHHVDETNTETEIETELGPVQERRKMVAGITTNNVSQKIIDEISSGFITSKPEGGVFDLPRVSDFHIPLDRHTAQKRKLEHENAGSKLKRANLASGLGLVESAGRSSENGRLGDTRHKGTK